MTKKFFLLLSFLIPAVLSLGNRVANRNGGSSPPTTIAHYSVDFSGTQGVNNWDYGYLTTQGDTTSWASSSLTYNSGNGRWEGTESFSTPWLSSTTWHPGVASANPAAARLTVSLSGSVTIQVSATLQASSTGVKVQTYNGTTLLGTLTISTSTPVSATYTTSFSLGGFVYLVLDPDGLPFSDVTTLDLLMTQP